MNQTVILFIIGQSIVILGAVVGVYLKIMLQIKELEIRMKVSENRMQDVEKNEEKMNGKLDLIIDNVHKIQVELQNKANR